MAATSMSSRTSPPAGMMWGCSAGRFRSRLACRCFCAWGRSPYGCGATMCPLHCELRGTVRLGVGPGWSLVRVAFVYFILILVQSGPRGSNEPRSLKSCSGFARWRPVIPDSDSGGGVCRMAVNLFLCSPTGRLRRQPQCCRSLGDYTEKDGVLTPGICAEYVATIFALHLNAARNAGPYRPIAPRKLRSNHDTTGSCELRHAH